MKITADEVMYILAEDIWTGTIPRKSFQKMADRFNEIAEKSDTHIPTKDLLEAEGQLRLF